MRKQIDVDHTMRVTIHRGFTLLIPNSETSVVDRTCNRKRNVAKHLTALVSSARDQYGRANLLCG